MPLVVGLVSREGAIRSRTTAEADILAVLWISHNPMSDVMVDVLDWQWLLGLATYPCHELTSPWDLSPAERSVEIKRDPQRFTKTSDPASVFFEMQGLLLHHPSGEGGISEGC
jgi:hypothetical protein